MLRFDLPPVYSNVARAQAFFTFIVCVAVYFGYGWASSFLVIMGFVRGFLSARKCPSHLALERIFLRFGIAGKKENAGAKMFADKLLFVGSSLMFVFWLTGSSLIVVPAIVLSVFAIADAVFGFCAGCWAYTLWHTRFSR